MPASQSSAVLSTLLLITGTFGGWLIGAWTKPPVALPSITDATDKGVAQMGDFTAFAARIHLHKGPDGYQEHLRAVIAKYLPLSEESEELAHLIMERWCAEAPERALSQGLPVCLTAVPHAAVAAAGWLAKATSIKPADLFKALTSPSVSRSAALGAGYSWGLQGRVEAVSFANTLPYPERAELLAGWFDGAAQVEPRNAQRDAEKISNEDDRAVAVRACLIALGKDDPETTLSSASGTQGESSVVQKAISAWVKRDLPAVWRFLTTIKNKPEAKEWTVMAIAADTAQRSVAGRVDDLMDHAKAICGEPLPQAILDTIAVALATDDANAALDLSTTLSPSGSMDEKLAAHRMAITASNALVVHNPAASWRILQNLAEAAGGVAKMAVMRSLNEAEQLFLPDTATIAAVITAWLERDPATALQTFCSSTMPDELQQIALTLALSTPGAGYSRERLAKWADGQPGAAAVVRKHLGK